MFVYHGSDVVVKEPVIFKKNRPLDYGDGFYTTISEDQAFKWAAKTSFRNNTDDAIVNVYEFDLEAARKELKIIEFEGPSAEWLDFLSKNRNRKNTKRDYDLVIGPIPTNVEYRVVVNYENGDLDIDEALKRLKEEELRMQVLFHTEKSLKFLTFVKEEKTPGSYESLLYTITTNTVMKIMEHYEWDMDYAIDKFVSSKLYTYLEDEKTKIWRCSTTRLCDLFIDEMEGHLEVPVQ